MNIIDKENPLLHVKLQKLPNFNNSFHQTLNEMFVLMKLNKGVGLAANQVGLTERFFLIDYEGREFVCADPKILKFGGPKILDKEGCLSYSVGYQLLIERYKTIFVSYRDEKGKLEIENFSGWLARIFQHELDHLNGILMEERAGVA